MAAGTGAVTICATLLATCLYIKRRKSRTPSTPGRVDQSALAGAYRLLAPSAIFDTLTPLNVNPHFDQIRVMGRMELLVV